MKIQILIDNKDSWIIPYAQILKKKVKKKGIKCDLFHSHEEIKKGDILVMLSCEKLYKKLNLNKHNLVVHESFLPQGKGWSPLTWQILENKNSIPVTLIEASNKIDSGPIYEQKIIKFKGHELIEELREKQGKITIELVLNFIKNYPNVFSKEQVGEESFYRRREAKDSKLDINKTINEQFNILRVSDNNRYPAYFIKNGIKYIIKIEKCFNK